MATVDWALVCDLAFFDRHGRLCLIAVTHGLVFPRLPVCAHRLTLVAHLVDLEIVDEVLVTVSVTTPRGVAIRPPDGDGLTIEVAGEYVLATLRDVPFVEEGRYGFTIALGSQPSTTVDMPVVMVQAAAGTGVH